MRGSNETPVSRSRAKSKLLRVAEEQEGHDQNRQAQDLLDDEGIVVSDGSPASSISVLTSTADSTPKKNESARKESTQGEAMNFVKLLRSIGLSRSLSQNRMADFTSSPRSLNAKIKEGRQRPRVFGKDLKDHLEETGNQVPFIIEVCAACIENHGLVDGIYRLSGISSNIRALKMSFERSSEEDSKQILKPDDPEVRQDIHNISSLLKLYCRELPESLTTFDLYDSFMKATRVKEEFRLGAIRDVVHRLPAENFRTLQFLLKHLNLVSQKGSETGMTSKNLSIVWAPNLLRSRSERSNPGVTFAPLRKSVSSSALTPPNGGNLQDIAIQATCTELLIRHCKVIFSKDLDLDKGDKLANLMPGDDSGYELGFTVNSAKVEIDIDDAIARSKSRPSFHSPGKAAETRKVPITKRRPKSIAISSPSVSFLENEGDEDDDDFRNRLDEACLRSGPMSLQQVRTPVRSTHTSLERSTSSVTVSQVKQQQQQTKSISIINTPSRFHLPFHFLQAKARKEEASEGGSGNKFNRKRIRLARPQRLMHSSSALLEEVVSENRRQISPTSGHQGTTRINLRSAKSSECVSRQHDIIRSQNARAFSSAGSNDVGRDVIDEVNTLQLSFDLEENEMRMMNCSLDDEDDENNNNNNSIFSLSNNGDRNNKNSMELISLGHSMANKLNLHLPRMRKANSKPGNEGAKDGTTTSSGLTKSTKPGRKKASLKAKVASVLVRRASSEEKRHVYSCNSDTTNGDTIQKISDISHDSRGRFMDDVKDVTERVKKDIIFPDETEDCNTSSASSSLSSSTQGFGLADKGRRVGKQKASKPNVAKAFDNLAYMGVESLPPSSPQDSGIESSSEPKTSYENVKHHLENLTYENVGKATMADSDSLEGYEDVSPPPPQSFMPNINHEPDYQNLGEPSAGQNNETFYQNLDFSPQSLPVLSHARAHLLVKPKRKCNGIKTNVSQSQKTTSSTSKTTKANKDQPHYSVVDLKTKKSEKLKKLEFDSRVYQNFEEGEDSVYQNLVFSTGKGGTSIRDYNEDDDVYKQVRVLRKSVQEVNALLDEEKRKSGNRHRTYGSVDRKQKFKRMSEGGSEEKCNNLKNNNNSGSKGEKHNQESLASRRAHFQALLSKFDQPNAVTSGQDCQRQRLRP